MAKHGPTTAPRLLPDGGTALILGSGPSLTQADVDYARQHVDLTIAVNDAYVMAPDADILYSGDAMRWWKWHANVTKPHVHDFRKYPAFTGRYRFGVRDINGTPHPAGVGVFAQGPQTGLTLDLTRLALGKNSTFQAINLAVHVGATKGVLLGVDMKPGKRFTNGAWRPAAHFFGRHADNSEPPYKVCLQRFETLVRPLQDIGFELVNCTPESALRCFPMKALREVFPEAVAV